MRFQRSSGVLCHPTSFPSRFGIGDLGRGAYDFVDWLAQARQQLWQVLPLGPTGYGDSPYQCFSAFAGNPMLISPDGLVYSGFMPNGDLPDNAGYPTGMVDFATVLADKHALLHRCYAHFVTHSSPQQREGLAWFQAQHEGWLGDFALFMAIKGHFGGGSWLDWPREVRLRRRDALDGLRVALADEVGYHTFVQWIFWEQWQALKGHANSQGIHIIGDIPIFVAEDSADVWANPDQFKLDPEGRPKVIAGVPPDLFSVTGQRWGNPHYDWGRMRADGFRWWLARVRRTLELVDYVRIDHFRGFAASWEIPARENTAVKGRWVRGPGAALFRAIQSELGDLPLIAEDLGVITPDVDALRHRFGFPGMKVLEFAFGEGFSSPYLPHNYEKECIVYPGTHDNNTAVGYWAEPDRTEAEKRSVLRYTGTDGTDIAWDFIRLAWASTANQAVALLQDVLGLGGGARMNYPSSPSGNWQWRYAAEVLTPELAARLGELTGTFGRAAPAV